MPLISGKVIVGTKVSPCPLLHDVESELEVIHNGKNADVI